METNGKYAPRPGNIPGTALNLGGVAFVAPPFNLDGVQEVMPLLAETKNLTDASATLKAVAAVLHVSLKRNYPDLTVVELVPLIDMGNALPALYAVCKISGIEFSKPGETMPASP